METPWRHVRTQSKGLCLAAKRAIAPGALILSCAPDAHALYAAEREACCHRCLHNPTTAPSMGSADPTPTPPLRCSRCGWLRYCGRRCQQADWADHKHECRALRRLKDKRPGPTLLMAARLVRRLATEGAEGPLAAGLGRLVYHEGRLTEQRRELLGQMAALVQELSLTRAMQKEDLAAHAFDARVAEVLARLGGLQFVARLLLRLSSNGFTITNAQNHTVGTGLYIGAIAANHSCSPNAHASFEGTTLRLRAIRPIAPKEEISIGYCDVARPRRARQADLLKGYGFLCLCARCASPGEDARERGRGTLVEEDGLVCPVDGCGGVLADAGYEAALYRAWRATEGGAELPKVQHEPRARACGACGATVEAKAVTELLGDLSLAEGLYERAQKAAARPLMEAADTQYRRVLPPVSARVLEVGGHLLQMYADAGEWPKARACLLATAVEAVQVGLHPPGSPAPAFDLALLGQVELQLEEGRGEMAGAAVGHLGEALRLLEVAQGEGSPLVAGLRGWRAQAAMMARGIER